MKRSATAKKFTTVDEYIAALPAAGKAAAAGLRQVIQKAIPGAEELINYNIPVFKLNGTAVIWFAVWRAHLGLYPRTAAMEKAIKEVADYAVSRGTIQFSMDKPLPVALVTKIAKFRLKEVREEVKAKKKKN